MSDGRPVRVRRSPAEEQVPFDNADAQIRTPASLSALLGVDVASISGLAPDGGRLRGYRGAPVDGAPTPLDDLLGSLPRGDAYWAEGLTLPSPVAVPTGDGGITFIPLEASVAQSLEGCVGQVTDLPAIDAFQANLETVYTFITHSRFDAVVYTKALPAVLQTYGWDVVPPAIWDRTGVLRVRRASAEPYLSIRMPTYESGHEITIRAPKELGEDLEAWLHETGALAGD
ncbi:MAG TPA: hypothetical protein VH062_35475 [Polyangiaceae bacterium]|jgi:hypothetical protein|nr:hypothetical protein [Polyangiaceae bacterium]